MDLRAFLLERALPLLDAAQDSTAGPRPTVETITALLQGVPLLHQDIVFLKLAGYSNASLEQLLRISSTVAQSGLERLQGDYAAVLGHSEDRCPWPAAWLAVTGAARAARNKDCPSLRQLIRILDGQTTWYEKDPIEQHRAGCLSCLELWTSLLEVIGWMRRAKPMSGSQLDALLSVLPLKEAGKEKKPLFKKLFG